MIKPNISNKTKNILGVDHFEQFMQRRNVKVSRQTTVIINQDNHPTAQRLKITNKMFLT